MTGHLIAATLLTLAAGGACAQQVADRSFQPRLAHPVYARGRGPVVCLDQAHQNGHTLEGRYWAFGELLRRDGYRLVANTQILSATSLAACRVFVSANARPALGPGDTMPRPTPSAFSVDEIAALKTWVDGGGALLLIADHMYSGGAAAKLAAAFDVDFTDGFALKDPEPQPSDAFRRSDGTLRDHAITRGRNSGESVSQVLTFAGQAFHAPRAAPLLVFPPGYVLLLPDKPWEFDVNTPRQPIEGWLQGAAQEVGRGRAAFFGEAAMFTAQLAGEEREPVGMNTPGAEGNSQFILNVLHWLTRKL